MMTSFEPTRVLCAVDFEQPIDGLLETATSIADRFDATLHLVHVWAPTVALTPEGGVIPEASELDAVSASLTQQLDRMASTVKRPHDRIKTCLVPGTPWKEIVDYAEAHACDLIVAGTHGRTGIARLVEGSVAERVVRASSVPVLVVPVSKEPPVEPVKADLHMETEETWIPEA